LTLIWHIHNIDLRLFLIYIFLIRLYPRLSIRVIRVPHF